LLLLIYEEAYNDAELEAALRKDYPSLEDLRKAIPGLILRHNLHGIDIDLRATQIAALALWLRCQRAYQSMNLQNGQRPPITRSNIVCAEPMPGDKDMLREFTAGLQPKVLGQLVEEVFDKMKLAGEAGSLLKIEEDIKAAAVKVKNDYVLWKKQQDAAAGFLLKEYAPKAEPDLFDFAALGDEAFLERAEEEIVNALRCYAQLVGEGSVYRRKLFAEDAGRGFAFIDVCRKRYDVVVMNPPFGEANVSTIEYMNSKYEGWFYNILSAFLFRSWELTRPLGLVGSIFDRTVIIKSSYDDFRNTFFLNGRKIQNAADTGWDVLDANVETFCMTMNSLLPDDIAIFFDLRREPSLSKRKLLLDAVYGSNVGRLHYNETLSSTVAFRELPN